MGGRRPTLPHAELAAAIKTNGVPQDFRLTELQQAEPVYQTLFELIGFCRKQNALIAEDMPPPPQSFEVLDWLLMRIYSGNATQKEASQILNGLVISPAFYRRLLVKLEALTPEPAWQEAEALEGITIKSNAEVLALVDEAVEPREFWVTKVGQAASAVVIGVGHATVQAFDFITGHRVVAVGLPLLLIASLTLFQIGLGSSPFDEQTPFPPPSKLRALSFSQGEEEDLYQFKAAFGIAISDYLLWKYDRALKTFESMKRQAGSLEKNLEFKKDKAEYASQLREYYFYFGLSHYALAHKRSLFSRDSKQHAQEAVDWLKKAHELALTHNLSEPGREDNFLKEAQTKAGRN